MFVHTLYTHNTKPALPLCISAFDVDPHIGEHKNFSQFIVDIQIILLALQVEHVSCRIEITCSEISKEMEEMV